MQHRLLGGHQAEVILGLRLLRGQKVRSQKAGKSMPYGADFVRNGRALFEDVLKGQGIWREVVK